MQQGHDVDEVLLVDLHDLHLGEEEVGRRQAGVRRVQAVAQVDDMTHAELVQEDVHLTAVPGVPEAQAPLSLQRVEGNVGRIAQVFQQPLDGDALPREADKIQIPVLPAQRFPPGAGRMEVDAQAAGQFQDGPRALRGRGEAFCFLDDVGPGDRGVTHGRCVFTVRSGTACSLVTAILAGGARGGAGNTFGRHRDEV